MTTTHPNAGPESGNPRVISPFAQTTATVQPGRSQRSSGLAVWLVSGLLALTVAGIIGYFSLKYLDDPVRTLPSFPLDKYLSDYRSMSGGKFKADLKVSADLGWKPDTGHLMVFTLQNDNRQLVVLVPPKMGGIFFEKGQTYQMALEVGDGGLVYADSCEKE